MTTLLEQLRAWPVDRQVALLFIVLFGLLALGTAAAAMAAVRAIRPDAIERMDRVGRDLRALWMAAVLFWLAWLSGPAGATTLFGVCAFLALREFVTLVRTRRADHRALLLAFFAVLPAQFVIVGLRRYDLFTVFVPVYVFLALPVASALGGDPQRFLERNAKLQWGIMVCVYGLSHAPALLLFDARGFRGKGAFLLMFLVAVTAAAHLAQSAAARRLRRRPVARQISRSFSWRAWGAGLAAAAAVGVGLSWITPLSLDQAAVIALIAGGAGTLGEFVMQALKRDAGVRHWGNAPSVTGAVGLLDRVAPLCFSAPVFFHAVRWYFERPAAGG